MSIPEPSAEWKWGVVERWSPAFRSWIRTGESVSLKPGETPEQVASRMEIELQENGLPPTILRIIVTDI